MAFFACLTRRGCFVIMLLDIIFVTILTPHRIEILCTFKALAATAVCISLSALAYRLIQTAQLSEALALILAIAVAGGSYAIVAVKFGVIGVYEIGHLPLGDRMLPILRKLKLLK